MIYSIKTYLWKKTNLLKLTTRSSNDQKIVLLIYATLSINLMNTFYVVTKKNKSFKTYNKIIKMTKKQCY